MKVDYKKLWILLIERKMSKSQLQKESELSPATLTKLNENEYVSMDVLTCIFKVLECDIGGIVEAVR